MLFLSLISTMIGFILGSLSVYLYYNWLQNTAGYPKLECAQWGSRSTAPVTNDLRDSTVELSLPSCCSSAELPVFKTPSPTITPGIYLTTVVSDFENAGYVFIHEFKSVIWIHINGIYRQGDRLMVMVCPQTCEAGSQRNEMADSVTYTAFRDPTQ